MNRRPWLAFALVTLAIVLVIVLAGCADPAPEIGTVTDKVYDDPDTITIPPHQIPRTCSGGYGSTPQTCTGPTYIPGQTIHHEAEWKLRLSHGEQAGWTNVDESTFHRVQVGDCYDRKQVRVVEIGCE